MKRGVRIKGIAEDALALGVSREHLRRVLAGKVPSRSLVERYSALKAQEAKPQPLETS